GPFLQLITEVDMIYPTFNEAIYEEWSLQENGSLTVLAKDHSESIIKEIAPLKMEVSKEEVLEVQQLLEENFWKLKEHLKSGQGNEEESIIVYVEEGEKTVTGLSPNHPRFLLLKEEILSLIDEDAYTKWQDKL